MQVKQTGKLLSAIIALVLLMASRVTGGQSSISSDTATAAPHLHFSIASVRENNSGSDKSSYSIPLHGDSITYTNYPLFYLIMFTNDFHNSSLVFGMPQWTKDTRYDIVAKVAPEDLVKYQSLPVLQRLAIFQEVLADRFKLRFHREPRELPALELTVAKGGPKLCAPDPNKPLQLKKKYGQAILQVAPGVVEAEGVTMPELAGFLSVVGNNGLFVDKTGLTGTYDFTLQFALHPTSVTNDPESSPEVPVLPTALKEQLGLAVKSGKAEFECFVVDHIERPTPN